MAEWIVINNPESFRIIEAFQEYDEILWKQNSLPVQKKDTVYIYVGFPCKAIKFKCQVLETDLAYSEMPWEKKFVNLDNPPQKAKKNMKLRLIQKYNTPFLNYDCLKENNVGHVRGSHKISTELSAYINKVTSNLLNHAEDLNLIESINSDGEKSAKKISYTPHKEEKQQAVLSKGQVVFPRNPQKAKNALVRANHKCEIDNNHYTFIRKSKNEKYTEPHHLVPMSFSDDFNCSLDVEANIVSLCSNCHNEIHYGENYEDFVKKLYDERKDELKAAGIDITIDKLLDMYK